MRRWPHCFAQQMKLRRRRGMLLDLEVAFSLGAKLSGPERGCRREYRAAVLWNMAKNAR
ncbi:hypothetical protein CBM2586_B130566 [Cupriavidus phytorum]|uniref:Uncharacterized protein n=1 Tax=Cupriavidus taiwanensis TaxID=164546 RepID=A0A975XIE2_9BURK|nr:hypothetical protein CBM2586_B130566 [Cupriavidus taiwanensis]